MRRRVLLLFCGGMVACAPSYEPPAPPPFSLQTATIPDSVDRALLTMELWRTRLGLSECFLDTIGGQVTALVNLVTLDMFVSPYGSVDSVTATSERAQSHALDCVRHIVRTWYLAEHPKPQRYRMTIPMSARLADAEIGGPISARMEPDRHVLQAITVHLYRSSHDIATCYLFARPVASPLTAHHTDLGGMVVVRFDVTPGGRVTNAQVVESTIRSGQVDSCLVQTIRQWRLPRNSGGVIEFPINFAPQTASSQTSAAFGE